MFYTRFVRSWKYEKGKSVRLIGWGVLLACEHDDEISEKKCKII
jgi:hypothetical protein